MRRENSPFNLSLLDLLTAALGAVIFLFVITPKGGATAAKHQQAAIYFDTASMRIHGTLPDSLLAHRPGDTLFAMLVDFRKDPKIQDKPVEKPQPPAEPEVRIVYKERPAPISGPDPKPSPRPAPEPPKPAPAKSDVAQTPTTTPAPKPAEEPRPEPKSEDSYRGDMPSVPAVLSFELKWADAADNVDLYVCRGNDCVFGNRRKDNTIGNWDSGKARNRLFGNDLRTNQEAVRQFDKLIPGTYTIYAMFKESERGRKSVAVETLVFTKDAQGKPRGQTFRHTLPLSDDRTRLVTVLINPDGTFSTR